MTKLTLLRKFALALLLSVAIAGGIAQAQPAKEYSPKSGKPAKTLFGYRRRKRWWTRCSTWPGDARKIRHRSRLR